MSLNPRHLALVLLLGALATGTAQAADPFYLNLLRDGKAAQTRGDLETAIWDLEVACFGLLDEPALLAEGLVHLALAQTDDGSPAAAATIERLLNLESGFSGYSQASLASDAKARFEDLLYRRLDPSRLAGLEAFDALTERREQEAFMAAGPDQRRIILAGRLAAEPASVVWLRMLADLETAQSLPGAAMPHLSALLALTPGDPLLLCERFRSATASGRCDIILTDLSSCPVEAGEAARALPILDCFTAQSSWQEATDYLQTLGPGVRSSSKIRKAEKQITRELRTQNKAEAKALALAEAEALAGDDTETDSAAFDSGTEVQTPPAFDPEHRTEAIPDTATPTEAPAELPVELPADAPVDLVESETISEAAPPPDPCEHFRVSARNGACAGLMNDLAICPDAAIERAIAPAIMKCYVNSSSWDAALAFAETLPPQVRTLSKIQKFERRATKQANKQAERAAAEAASDSTVDSPPVIPSEVSAGDEPPVIPGVVEGSPDSGSASARDDKRENPPTPSELEDATRLLATAVTSKLALENPTHPESNLLAAQGAYRAAQWDKAVAFFRASGGPTSTEPLLLFYYAISLYETGNPSQAATLLDQALPSIRRTPFVESYVARINAAAGRN